MAIKKKATKKVAKVAAPKINAKNITSAASKAASLNEVVFQLAPKHTNEEIFAMLDKQKRTYSVASVQWYASKARAGVRR